MYQLNSEKMFFDMEEGQAVVINFATGEYYGSTLLGAEIMSRLMKGNAPESILEAVRKLPGCPADIKEKLDAFVKELEDKEILVKGETVPGGNEAIDAAVAEDGFDLQVKEYKEVQDLLVADPIHEVQEEEGWPQLRK